MSDPVKAFESALKRQAAATPSSLPGTSREFLAALRTFQLAASDLARVWPDGDDDGVDGYPFRDDFDQISHDITLWYDAQKWHRG